MLAQHFENLLTQDAYSHPVSSVRLVETPTSWVLITDVFAYKIKRPIQNHILDFTSLERRRFFCERELVLNQRFSEGVYIDIVPISQKDRKTKFNAEGVIIDFAVRMKTLPTHQEMRHLRKQNQVSSSQVFLVGKKLATFHNTAEAILGKRYDYLQGLQVLIEEPTLFRPVLEQQFGWGGKLDKLVERTQQVFSGLAGKILKRQAAGLVRDVHGDLHAGNIILDQEPIFFDCIDFNDELRYLDPLLDLAFLATELDLSEQDKLSQVLIEAYAQFFADSDFSLLPFYQSLRAQLFLVLSLLHLPAHLSEHDHDLTKANIHALMELSEEYLSKALSP